MKAVAFTLNRRHHGGWSKSRAFAGPRVAQVLPLKATTMHIDIVGDESIDRQTRIYAEYRLFAALAPSTDLKQFSRAQLVLRRARGPEDGKQTECVVDVELNDGAVARFSAAGGHPYQAVNRAIERVRRAASSMNAVG